MIFFHHLSLHLGSLTLLFVAVAVPLTPEMRYVWYFLLHRCQVLLRVLRSVDPVADACVGELRYEYAQRVLVPPVQVAAGGCYSALGESVDAEYPAVDSS